MTEELELTPPFSLVKEIRLSDGHYNGYDADGRFLMELTKVGADALVSRHGVEAVGFQTSAQNVLAMISGLLGPLPNLLDIDNKDAVKIINSWLHPNTDTFPEGNDNV